MSEDRVGGCGARVGEPPLKPFVRILEAFEEEVAHHGVEILSDLLPHFDARDERVLLAPADFFAALVRFVVIGVVFLVGGHHPEMEGYGVLDKLHEAGPRREGKDLVRANTEVADAGCRVVFE